MPNNSILDITMRYARKQSVLVNKYMEETPFLATMPMEPSTHSTEHVYEKVTTDLTISELNFGGALTELVPSTGLDKVSLQKFGGYIQGLRDVIKRQNGATLAAKKASYFAKKMGIALPEVGNKIENEILVNLIRQYIIDNGTENTNWWDAGGTGTALNSILCVTFKEGHVTGLYDPEVETAGNIINIMDFNGGNDFKDSSNRPVYQQDIETVFGFMISDIKWVSAIFNMDASNVPSETQLDEMVNAARANSKTVIVGHPSNLLRLNPYKGNNLETRSSDMDIDRFFGRWAGIPIIKTWNYNLDEESAVS